MLDFFPLSFEYSIMYTERAKTKILGELLPFTFLKKILAEIEGSCFF